MDDKVPIYFYKLIRQSNSKNQNGNFQKFIVAKVTDYRFATWGPVLLLSYRKNNRKLNEVSASIPGTIYETDRYFSLWFYDRNDEKAIELCKQYLSTKLNKRREDIKKRAMNLLYDQAFMQALTVSEVEVS